MNSIVNRISTTVNSDGGGGVSSPSPPLRSNKDNGATKGSAVTPPTRPPLVLKLSIDVTKTGHKTVHAAPDPIPVYNPAPAFAKVDTSKDMSEAESLKMRVSNKVKGKNLLSRWCTLQSQSSP